MTGRSVQLWLTCHNRYSVAALLGRLEEIVPGVKPRLVQEPGEVAPGILLCSFTTAQAQEVRREWVTVDAVALLAEQVDNRSLVVGL